MGRAPAATQIGVGERPWRSGSCPSWALAVAGLVLSLVAHVAALLGYPQPMGSAAWALHAGIIVVWLPAVLASRRLGVDPKSKDFWKVARRGCPPWVGWVTGGFFAYAVVNFLVFFVGGRVAAGPGPHRRCSAGSPATGWPSTRRPRRCCTRP